MKKRTRIMLLLLVLAAVLAVLTLFAARPAMPATWNSLRVGMTEREATPFFGPDADMGGMGFWEIVDYPAPMFGAHSYWRLGLHYDRPINHITGDAKLVRVTARFVHPFWLLSSRSKRLV
jgi:hypothetical protein